MAAQTRAESEAEYRKRFVSELLQGQLMCFIDNVNEDFGSEVVSTLVTQRTIGDRILGVSRNVKLRNNLMFMITGNASSLTPELVSRSVITLLKSEVPTELRNYKNPNLISKIQTQDRFAILSAVCTIIQKWIDDGATIDYNVEAHRMKDWAQLLGGILKTVPEFDGHFLQSQMEHKQVVNEPVSYTHLTLPTIYSV